MPVKHGLLGLLARRPRYGYELKAEFDLLSGGFWDLNVGQIYSTLERLLKDGLVTLDEGDGAGEGRKIYRLTPSGQAELDLWLAQPPLKPRPLRDEVYVRLGLLVDRDVSAAFDLIETQRRVYHLQMAELTRQKLALARGQRVADLRRELLLDAALLHVEADLKWLDTCDEKLRRVRI
ncbi:MAG: helix-turn-helix transcriptional regulator [Chloroflexi bacterium]|nr:helix-turn-helix transcriptional regulator [Chloroflexota bacterium]